MSFVTLAFQVEAKHLRYAVGCVLAEGEKEVDAELKRKFEEEGFKIISLPEVENAVRTTFPYASTFSIFIAISKVYPRLNDYIQVFVWGFIYVFIFAKQLNFAHSYFFTSMPEVIKT